MFILQLSTLIFKEDLMKFIIESADKIDEILEVPGDKSISHRSLIINSLAEGKGRITGLLEAEDCLKTLNIMRNLGVKIRKEDAGKYVISGRGLQGLQEPGCVLDCGNSGTSMRLITGLLAGQDFYSVLSGDSSLRGRPMERIKKPLHQMGAEIWSRQGGLAPMSIKGGNLSGIVYEQKVASAQVKSCILLAGLFAQGSTTVIEPAASRDHTERMLADAGARISVENNEITLAAETQKIKPLDIKVPGDISSAAFLVAAALLVPRAKLKIKNVGINPTRSGFLDVLQDMGANINLCNRKATGGEPVADIETESSSLQAVEIGGDIIPKLLDEIPILAILSTQAEGRTIISDAEELRVKETDRLAAMADIIEKMGGKVEELEDGLIIDGPVKLQGDVSIASRHDHRVAMSAAVAGLIADGPVEILNSEVINTSFPEFPDILKNFFGRNKN